MHLLLKAFYRAKGGEDDGTFQFQILSCGVCPVCSPADPPTHYPLQPHDDPTSATLRAISNSYNSQVIVLIADYLMTDTVAPRMLRLQKLGSWAPIQIFLFP